MKEVRLSVLSTDFFSLASKRRSGLDEKTKNTENETEKKNELWSEIIFQILE